jgi:hypothetical protein
MGFFRGVPWVILRNTPTQVINWITKGPLVSLVQLDKNDPFWKFLLKDTFIGS